MNNKKSEAYKKLVYDMQKKYPKYDLFNHNDNLPLWAPYVKINNEMVCVCNEINLYSYWQGFHYAEKTPKIKYLLVAQDAGNVLFREDSRGLNDYLEMNRTGKWIAPKYKQDANFGTGHNLIELFRVLGRDIMQLNDDLFFTNFCLGYRSGKKGGDMTAKLMMNDAAEFKRLCDILEPENILCLGRITFECVYEALTGKKYDGIGNDYNQFLSDHKDIIARCGEVDAKIYPLAHCGSMGIANRNRGLPKQEDSLYYQKQDWKKIVSDDEVMADDEALDLDENKHLEEAITRLHGDNTKENFTKVIMAIYYRMHEGGELQVPIVIKDRETAYDKGELDEYEFAHIKSNKDGKNFIMAFTDINEEIYEEYPDMYLTSISDLFEELLDEDNEEAGIVFNPHDDKIFFTLTKEFIKYIMSIESKYKNCRQR